MTAFSSYPRPQLERKGEWLNLNGEWKYEIINGEQIVIKKGTILVPYSPEAEKSGVGHILQSDETLIYSREVEIPFSFNREEEELILHFGAVDYEATVVIDGEDRLIHRGGYLPFSLKVSKSHFTLSVIVKDPTDTREQERGKQKLKRGGIWYTPQSGIWQTVWLEKVKKKHIENIKIVPSLTGFSLTVSTTEPGSGTVTLDGMEYDFTSGEEIFIPVENPRLWSPEDPYLYYFTLAFGDDTVSSYTGLRTFTVEEDEKGVKRLFLNGRPYFHHGLLDQGYYKEGLYTPSSEEEMVGDIILAKRMGFNTLRKHIKIEPLRWYYHCDRLGIIVWQDMPSGGGKYSPAVISAPLIIGSHIKDSHYSLLKRKDKEMREEFVRNLESMIELLGNVTSIAMWVPFNEGWGQFDSVKIGKMVEKLDPTRTVDYHSGWLDQKKGNFLSKHVYFRPYHFKKDRYGRCVILSEFGGYGLEIEGHRFSNDKFEYRGYKTTDALTDAVIKMYHRDIFPAKEKGLSAAIYTQLSDVEDELNGLITYDRKVVKMDEKRMKEMGESLIRH